MKYLAEIHGGIGPDVWELEREIDAVDIDDALMQAKAIAEDEFGTVQCLSQS